VKIEKKRYKFERVALEMDALVTILLLASMSHYAYGIHLYYQIEVHVCTSTMYLLLLLP
jgi:hypothetical protein